VPLAAPLLRGVKVLPKRIMKDSATLYFMCGKMASGKSTLAKVLAAQHNAVLLAEDNLLAQLFPGEITDLKSYVTYSTRLKNALSDHICELVGLEVSVVLDFPANTKGQREWFSRLIERSGVPHQLHFVDATNETCKNQLRERNAGSEAHLVMQDEATFDLLLGYFVAPEPEEGFLVVHHQRG
jgi:predicted kinase